MDTDDVMMAEDVLARAADRVERGWCQGIFQDEEDRVCLVGALAEVGLGHALEGLAVYEEARCGGTPVGIAARAVVRELGCGDLMAAACWNNEPGRTVEEIAATFRNAKRQLAPAETTPRTGARR